ncbi:MAG: hypothetical protein NZ523_05685 [Elioraea sp.]|nr:hypothetical protein [Elioraea sp.]
MLNLRTTAVLAAGLLSALAALAALRGLPLGSVAFWFSAVPLFAAGFAFGTPAVAQATAVGALVTLISGGVPGSLVWLLLFALPASLMLHAALPRTGGAPLALAWPFALLALWPAGLLVAAEVALAGQPGGLSGVLHNAVLQALQRMGPVPQIDIGELAAMIVRIKPLAFALWFALVMTTNAAIAQRLVAARGLMTAAPARWAMAALPRWYWPLALAAAAASLLVPGEAGFAVRGLAMMLAVPLVLQGLAVLHVISLGRPARPVLLAGVYVGLVLFFAPAALALAGLGVAEHFLDLRGRRPPPGTGLRPPED